MEAEEPSRRRRGRPKTTGASDRAGEIRREQIRSAQRAYRVRKGDKMRDLEAANAELKAKYELMEKSLLSICEEATQSNFLTSHSESHLALMIRQSGNQFFNNRLLSPLRTCSYLESSFARRVQRRSLELAYQVFDNPGADPQSVYRTFRLVACFKDKEKMKPYFDKLLRAKSDEDLELYGLPFYGIGGAGKHYARKEPIPNVRLPKRLLGITSCDTEPYAESLERLGYGGRWLDSFEVECYLRERGIVLEPGSTTVPVYGIRASGKNLKRADFDIDQFLERICGDCSILGRAPGYREDLVDAAMNETLRRG